MKALSKIVLIIFQDLYKVLQDDREIFINKDFNEIVCFLKDYDDIIIVFEDISIEYNHIDFKTNIFFKYYSLFNILFRSIYPIIGILKSQDQKNFYCICKANIDIPLQDLKNPINFISVSYLNKCIQFLKNNKDKWVGIFLSSDRFIVFKNGLPLLERRVFNLSNDQIIKETKEYVYRHGYIQDEDFKIIYIPDAIKLNLHIPGLFFSSSLLRKNIFIHCLLNFFSRVFYPINAFSISTSFILLMGILYYKPTREHLVVYDFEKNYLDSYTKNKILIKNIFRIINKLEFSNQIEGSVDYVEIQKKYFFIKTTKVFQEDYTKNLDKYNAVLKGTKDGQIVISFQ